jgi:hypothetical protein
MMFACLVMPARMRGLEAGPLQRQLQLPLGRRRLVRLGDAAADTRADSARGAVPRIGALETTGQGCKDYRCKL